MFVMVASELIILILGIAFIKLGERLIFHAIVRERIYFIYTGAFIIISGVCLLVYSLITYFI